MESTEILIETTIKPKRMVYRGDLYNIDSAEDMFTINKYKIYVTRNNIYKITIDAKHPNYDHHNNEFCLPNCIKGKHISKEIIELIEDILSTFNLDNCYYNVWGHFRYSKNE